MMLFEYQNVRIAEYAARIYLKEHGYNVIRIAERHEPSSNPFHLIAWNDPNKFIFIRLRSPRKGTSHNALVREISRLTAFFRKNNYPGCMQFWIYEQQSWKQYQILHGGAIRIREPPDAIF
jgi:hypothetical protein